MITASALQLLLAALTFPEARDRWGRRRTRFSASLNRNGHIRYGIFSRDCYAGHRGEQTPRTLIFGDRRIAVVEVVDVWLAPDYKYFKLRCTDGDTYLVRHNERSNTWELTMFRAEHHRG